MYTGVVSLDQIMSKILILNKNNLHTEQNQLILHYNNRECFAKLKQTNQIASKHLP